MSRVHCAVLNARTGPRFTHVHSVTAAMARGKRPVTFRTRKLSLSAPMVLPWERGGRVGRRRTTLRRAPADNAGALRHSRISAVPRYRLRGRRLPAVEVRGPAGKCCPRVRLSDDGGVPDQRRRLGSFVVAPTLSS